MIFVVLHLLDLRGKTDIVMPQPDQIFNQKLNLAAGIADNRIKPPAGLMDSNQNQRLPALLKFLKKDR